ncbi:MAG TPA: alkaline phosphatase [Bacteroidales bacterium]|nr:alkaline phosphatase [Bacteroidales bacterium]HPT10403.1 alkaline phosphatase [Bacteroidales bacterium]
MIYNLRSSVAPRYVYHKGIRPALQLMLLTVVFFVFQNCLQAGLPQPKNIILLIGDGMGYNHIRCLDFYQGIEKQPFEEFPVRLFMATCPVKAGSYSEDNHATNRFAPAYNTLLAWSDTVYLKKQVTESAAAATALATGFKTYNNAIGMSVNHDTLSNMTEWAKQTGRSAGVVTSVPFSHATPAGFTAHNKTRVNYSEIAYQQLLSSRCDVIMGCGNPMFDDNGKAITGPWKKCKNVGDSAFWQQILQGSGKQVTFTVKGKQRTVADCNGDGKADAWTMITTEEDFRKMSDGPTPLRVLGCPEVSPTLQQSRKSANNETRNSPPWTTPLNQSVPSLATMTAAALNVLDNNPQGLFLMVEGGAIDWACHDNHKGRLIEELTGFAEAVNTVIDWVEKNSNWEETLVIVTGDHETGLLWGGNPFTPVTSNGKGNLPSMQFNATDHSNSLIPFYAKGTGSDLYQYFADEYDTIRGPYIQNSEVAQLIRFMFLK